MALDKNTDSLEDVRAVHGGDVEYLPVTNTQNGEMTSFHRLLAKVNTTEKGHVTFYAHAKGVKYHADPHATPHLWTNIMYETCLDYLPWVDALLHDHVFAGTFKKIGRKFGASSSAWHYSGTFYWFRNRDIFSRNWNVADYAYWGSESWPGKVSTAKEGGSLFMAADSGHLNVYGVDVWHHHILPYLDTWREIHEDMRTHAR